MAGADRLDRALAQLAEDCTDARVAKVAGELVLGAAKPKARSSRVQRSGKVSARQGVARVQFGGPATPWAGPSHFGHGSPGNPRPQGGYMIANPFLYDAADQRREQVVDLYLRRCVDAIRSNGL